MDIAIVNITVGEALTAIGSLMIIVAFMVAMWHFINRITRVDDHDEIVNKHNLAYGAQRTALTAAQGIGMMGALEPYYGNGWDNLAWMAGEGLWIFALLLIVRKIVDWVVLWKISNHQALIEGNLGVGFLESGYFLGFGLILGGTLKGEATDWQTGFKSSLLFTGLALVSLILVYFAHEGMTRYNVRQGLRDGLASSGIESGAVLVAISLPLRYAVSGDFTDWVPDIKSFLLNFAAGLVILYLGRWLVDKYILTSCTVSDLIENNAYAGMVVLGGSFITISAIATVIVSQLGVSAIVQ